MGYWDTSALVKLYIKESNSAWFLQFAEKLTTPIFTSRLAVYESRTTFRRKEEEGIIGAGVAQILYNELLSDIQKGEIRLIELSPVLDTDYERAINLCFARNPSLHVRTLDAIHLASASAAKEQEIVATDKRLREAALFLGFTVIPK